MEPRRALPATLPAHQGSEAASAAFAPVTTAATAAAQPAPLTAVPALSALVAALAARATLAALAALASYAALAAPPGAAVATEPAVRRFGRLLAYAAGPVSGHYHQYAGWVRVLQCQLG